MRHGRRMGAAVLLSFLLLTGGCGETGGAEAGAEVAEPAIMALTQIQPGRKNIYLIVKNLDSDYWKTVIRGAGDAGRDMGCNVYYSGAMSETDWEIQDKILETCVERGADAVLISPNDSVKLAPRLEELYGAGLPLVMVDTAPNTDRYDVCYMTDNLLAGQKAGEKMVDMLLKAGHTAEEGLEVGVIVGSAGSQTINERLAGFYQYWTNHAPKTWRILGDIQNCGGSADVAKDQAVKLIEERPDLAALFSTNNSPTAGVSRALMEEGRTDIAVVGFDYCEEVRGLIRAGDAPVATVLQRQYDMSYLGVLAALDILRGSQTGVKFVDTGVVTVDHESLNTPEVQSVVSNNDG